MSDLARRTEVAVRINGVDVSPDIRSHLISLTYTDNEEDKTDDLSIELEDRDRIWLKWFMKREEQPDPSAVPASGSDYKIGDVVMFTGGLHHHTSMGDARGGNRTAGLAVITNIARTAPFPIHVIGGAYRGNIGGSSNVWGWVTESQIQGVNAPEENEQEAASGGGDSIKGGSVSAAIIMKNWHGDGKDRVLECGTFEIDNHGAKGAPSRVSIKATSLPYNATVRTATHTRAWENISLSGIAGEIAARSGMTLMYESGFDPFYFRREQVNISDIVFLQDLCKNAGISLKASSNMLILFDAAEYEQKPTVRKVKFGEADVKSWRFNASTNDVTYKDCRVSYTDPDTGETIEYTYTPRSGNPDGQTLVINEKVNTREEARQLAMRRWRGKNRNEQKAEFTLVGDVTLVSGVTVNVEGWYVYDGKYIIENAQHMVTGSGYTVMLRLRLTMEE
ncbi:MAG: hypothetical protein FWE60_02490 [Oscillospiraceae bacterium]|nr:hypothetical protein [Oscillospiraceae bacterium]